MVLTKAGFSIVLRRFPDIQESFLQKCNERNKENTAANKALDRRLDKMAQPAVVPAEMADLSPGASGAVRMLVGRGKSSEALLSDAAADHTKGNPPSRLRKGGSPSPGGVASLPRSNTATSLTRSNTGQLSSSHLAEALSRRPSLMPFGFSPRAEGTAKLMGATIRKVRGANHAIRACRRTWAEAPGAGSPAPAEAAHPPPARAVFASPARRRSSVTTPLGAVSASPPRRRSSVTNPLRGVVPVAPPGVAPRPPSIGRDGGGEDVERGRELR